MTSQMCPRQLYLPRRLSLFATAFVLILCVLLAKPALAQGSVHVVQPGESLSVIAVRYGVSMAALASANGINNTNHVWVGQQLAIPGSGSGGGWNAGATGTLVTVGRGDSLSLIAAMNGMTIQELMDLNGLSNPNHVWVGQQLQVRGGAHAAQSVAATAPSGDVTYHVVQPGDSLSAIAAYHGVTMQSIMNANGLANPNNVWAGQRLQIVGGRQPGINQAYAPPSGSKRIVVDLSDQTLTAWQGDTVSLYTNISSGTNANPTVTGYYRIDRKYPTQRMTGPGYDIPDVSSVMYFWKGYAFHEAYWHNNFGSPMSHGCVHLRPGEAQWLYGWADVGTEVYVNW